MSPVESWNKVRKNLKKSQPQHAYATWFEPLVCIGLNDNILIIEVPNQFFFEWIQSHYKEAIKNEVDKEFNAATKIKYTVSPEGSEKSEETTKNPEQTQSPPPQNKNLNINSRYTFSSFIEGTHNQFAKAAALKVSDNPGQQSFNP